MKAWVRGAHEALKLTKLRSSLNVSTALKEQRKIRLRSRAFIAYLLLEASELANSLLEKRVKLGPACLFIAELLGCEFFGLV